MSLRMPQSLSTSPRFDTGVSALGRLGRELEGALARLRSAGRGTSARDDLVRAAGDATWSFFVQREACGMLDHGAAVHHYDIPSEVLAKVGAR